MNNDAIIFHIAMDADIEYYRAHAEYRCASLDSEGFVHCCDRQQLAGVVTRYYKDTDHLQLLLIDPDKLTHPLIRENTMGGSELFPHVYGIINSEAIMNVIPFGLGSTEREGLFA